MADNFEGFLKSPIVRVVATAAGPLWLPFYWLAQLLIAFVGICYYIVVERTLAVVFTRTINRTRVKIRWYYVPLLIVALPFALAIQIIIAIWSLIVWWHGWLGRWQWGCDSAFGIVAAVIFEAVAVLVFVGSIYHPLPWKLMARPDLAWYHFTPFSGTPVRELLTGVVAFGALVLIVAPILIGQFRSKVRLQQMFFLPRQIIALFALYTTLRYVDGPFLSDRWVFVSECIVIALLLIGLMILAWRTLKGGSSWRQFVWFSAVRLLEKKRIALFSLGAVVLCTAMLLIVMSIMGGFLDNIRNASHGLMGDVVLEGDRIRGFPYYEDFIKLLNEEPFDEIVEAATPVVYSPGLIKVPQAYTDSGKITAMVNIVGIDLDGKIAVSNFGNGLTRHKQNKGDVFLDRDLAPPDDPKAERLFGLIYGLDALARRDSEANYHRRVDYYTASTLSVIPVNLGGNVLRKQNPVTAQKFYLVDDSRTGVFDIDQNSVYIGFEQLQKMLWMTEQETLDDTFAPARIHQMQIKLKEGVSLPDGHLTIGLFWQMYVEKLTSENKDPHGLLYSVSVQTWEDYNRGYISAVETEKQLMTILFGIISIVAVIMLLCIFYMIVVEKTRDIGIMKSIGASATQIAMIFLAYAAVIGAIGSTIGTVIGWYVVTNINNIHDWIVNVFGWRAWDREVYVFDLVPDTVKFQDARNIVIVAIIASLIGALVPAIRAARMNPVEALRHE